jgi:hypothetical protein
MNKYLKYSVLHNSNENQRVEVPVVTAKSEVKEITEQSTPIEMANFISMKLVEFIQRELNKHSEFTTKAGR